MQAANFLAANGYTKLSNLDGGILRWGSERKPTK
jgi:rhodanese-related sulfurtransferase